MIKIRISINGIFLILYYIILIDNITLITLNILII